MSARDWDVVYSLAVSEPGKVKELRDTLHLKLNEFSPFRYRLMKKGLVICKWENKNVQKRENKNVQF